MTELTRLAAWEMADRLRAGDISSSELVERHLDLAERQNRALNAWLTIDRDSLAESGGLAIYLGEKPKAVAALTAGDGHPWRNAPQVSGNDEAVPKAALAR